MSAATLDLEAAAALVGLHAETMRRRAKSGQIPGAKPGKEWIFIEADLLDWLRTQYRGQAAPQANGATVKAPPPIPEASATRTARRYDQLLSKPSQSGNGAHRRGTSPRPSATSRRTAPAASDADPPSVVDRYAALLAHRPTVRR